MLLDMKLQKIRWSKVYESTEEELTDFLQARGIAAERKTLEEFQESDQTPAQSGVMTIWCAEGSFAVRITQTNTSMQPGDAARLPVDAPFTVTAGISGCVYYESVIPASAQPLGM
jgi:mannose-6-phosphate isomerase class I